jgi:hypothetical protein
MSPTYQLCKSNGKRLRCEILFGCFTVAVGTNVWAGEAMGQPTSSLGPRITLYVSQPLWSRGTETRYYGIRLEQVPSEAVPSQRVGYGPFRHKVLLDLQIRPHSDVRIELATRFTWDLSRETFGANSKDYKLAIKLPLSGFSVAAAQPFHP